MCRDLAVTQAHQGQIAAVDRVQRVAPPREMSLHADCALEIVATWCDAVSSEPALITPGTLYATNTRGQVIALDAVTGAKRWVSDLGVEVSAAPTVAGETVLIGTKDGKVLGLDTATGATALLEPSLA